MSARRVSAFRLRTGRIQLVAFEKIVAGALQCLFAGLIVFPIATVVPATPVHLDVNWLILLTLIIAVPVSMAAGALVATILLWPFRG